MNVNQKLTVRDVMNNEVYTLTATATVQEAAKVMRDEEIGSVVIVDPKDNQKPIGIITERDMNNRVVAENKIPNTIQCKEIMSSPVKSISPNLPLTDAMHQMATQRIKRLIVMENQQMKGIISQSDILEIAPYMIEILQEKVNNAKENYETEFMAGYCQLCRNWSDILIEVDDVYICERCKAAGKQPDF
jgi:signal-transduction protein with cAMP-binding, CBS, and nucleotidyltransferase domain